MNIVGERYGKLVVIKRVEDHIQPSGIKKPKWLCQCDCGNTKEVLEQNLRNGQTTSCGCYVKEHNKVLNTIHGGCYERLYNIWASVFKRCYNTNHIQYNNYGGRGILVCEEWHDYEKFKKWALENGYSENAKKSECSLDRIDVNGNYEPTNCRFVNSTVQNRNTRRNVYLTHNGETHCVTEWAEILNMPSYVLFQRLKRGWTVERTLTTKAQCKKKGE